MILLNRIHYWLFGFLFFQLIICPLEAADCLDVNNRPNLLHNSGFEQGRLSPLGWYIDTPKPERQRSWQVAWIDDHQQAYSGQRSIKIANTYNSINADDSWEDRVIINSRKIYLPKKKWFLFTNSLVENRTSQGRTCYPSSQIL